MTTTTAPRLRRSRRHRILGGVCGGLAERFGVSPWLVRLAFVLLTPLPFFPGIPVYLILWIAIPRAE
jgi:phage shock protein PspC (stress-responsive transcriptional regulator)